MNIGFIDYELDEWHANEYPAMLKAQSGGELEVAYAWAKVDAPAGRLTSAEWCARQGAQLCGGIAEVVEKSDALVVLAPDNVEQHEALCQLPLSSGKRCYVDKTFAPSRAVAEALFERAEKYGTPCFSTSALRFAQEYAGLETGAVYAASSCGPNGFDTYAVHQLEPLTMLVPAQPKRVVALESGNGASLLVEYADGRTATVTCAGRGDMPFTMQLCGAEGSASLTVQSDYFGAFIGGLVDFFKTGVAPVPAVQTITIMALREAGLQALAHPGTWVAVP